MRQYEAMFMARRRIMFAMWATAMMLLIALVPIAVALPGLNKENELTMKQSSGTQPDYQDGTGDYKDVYLYFHRTTQSGGQYVLDTTGGSNGVDIMPNAGSVTFRIGTPLTKNLKVLGHEIDPTTKGFWLDLTISAFPSGTITIEVLDNDLVVANQTRNLAGGEDRWIIPFVGGVDSYTFLKGNTLGVRISTTGSSTFQYSTNDKLWVLCDPIDLTGDTYNINGVKTKTFQPNAIQDEKHVIIKGKINDAWGPGDISSVSVEIRDPAFTSIVNASATMDGMNYTYDWNYSGGLQAGTYSVLITMQDMQSNIYTYNIDFSMATYGVHLDSPQAAEAGLVTGSVEKGGCMDYTVSILNTGAVATSYTLSQSSSDVSGWSLSITPSQTGTVQPSESKVVTVKVCADDGVEEGTQAVFYVQAVASGDPTAKDSIQLITTAVPKINLTLRWTTLSSSCTNLVNTGGNVTCSFELKNSGLTNLNITLSMDMTKGSPDWSASISPSSIVSSNLQLFPEQTIGGTLNVNAPDDPSKINETIINIQARTNDMDPPLTKLITATTIMSTGISLEVVGGDTKEIDADKVAEFFIIVSNTDPNNDHTISMSTTSTAGWKVDFVATAKSFSLNAQESKTVNIKVTPSNDAPAGTYNIDVTGQYQDNPSTWDKVSLKVKIREKHELKMTINQVKREVGADEAAVFTVNVENKGNVDERSASLSVNGVGGKLKANIEINNNSSFIFRSSIPKGQTVTFTVKITPKKDAVHMEKGTWRIDAIGGGGATDSKTVEVVLKKDTQDLFGEIIADYQMWILIALVVVVLMFFVMVRRR